MLGDGRQHKALSGVHNGGEHGPHNSFSWCVSWRRIFRSMLGGSCHGAGDMHEAAQAKHKVGRSRSTGEPSEQGDMSSGCNCVAGVLLSSVGAPPASPSTGTLLVGGAPPASQCSGTPRHVFQCVCGGPASFPDHRNSPRRRGPASFPVPRTPQIANCRTTIDSGCCRSPYEGTPSTQGGEACPGQHLGSRQKHSSVSSLEPLLEPKWQPKP